MINKILRLMLVTILVLYGVPLDFRVGKVDLNVLKIERAEASGESWLSGYSYRKAVVIDNTSGSAQTDYQVKVTNPIYDETGLVGSWHMEEGTGRRKDRITTFRSGYVLLFLVYQSKSLLPRLSRELQARLELPFLLFLLLGNDYYTRKQEDYTKEYYSYSQEKRKLFEEITCQGYGYNSLTQIRDHFTNKLSTCLSNNYHQLKWYHNNFILSRCFEKFLGIGNQGLGIRVLGDWGQKNP